MDTHGIFKSVVDLLFNIITSSLAAANDPEMAWIPNGAPSRKQATTQGTLSQNLFNVFSQSIIAKRTENLEVSPAPLELCSNSTSCLQ